MTDGAVPWSAQSDRTPGRRPAGRSPIGKAAASTALPQPPSTSQKVPHKFSSKGFTLVSPMMINTRTRKAHTDTVIEQAPYYGSVAEQDETDPAHRGYVMKVTSY